MVRICLRPSGSGSGSSMILSNLPGLSNAGSKISSLLVAAMILMLEMLLKPSISVRSCMKVRWTSLSPEVPESRRCPARLSISSMKKMAGARSQARAKRSLTSFAPSPMNFWISSEATRWMKVVLVLFATALASKVFPVPGGPCNKTPRGGWMPSFLKSSGL